MASLGDCCRALGGRGTLAPGLLLATLVAGCASLTPHRVPTAQELASVREVEIEVLAADTVVGREASKGADDRGGRRDPPRIVLGIGTERAIAATLNEAGPALLQLPLRRTGEPVDRRASARIEVMLDAATLACGDGPDPLTALWVHFRVRLSLPRVVQETMDESGSPVTTTSGRGWLGPAWIVAADPRPRRLSMWEADGGEPVRKAVAALAAQAAPLLLADLRAAPDPVGGPVAPEGPGPGAEAPGAAPAPALATNLRVELLAAASGDGTGLKVAAGFGGFVLGGVAGALYGVAKCGEAMGSGGGKDLAAIAFVACAMVAVPVGALVGTAVGTVKGVEIASDHLAKRAAEWRAETARKTSALSAAAAPTELAAEAGAAVPVGELIVRLVEVGGSPARSELELELTLHEDGPAGGRARKVCLRGPGPVPTELWLQRESGLLRGAVRGHFERAAGLELLGIEPRPGDGPCARDRNAPPPPGAGG